MAENNEKTTEQATPLFRQSVLDRISSPEQLTDYLKVTSAGVWIVLVAVIILLSGLVAWACIGNLYTTSDAYIDVNDNEALIYTTDSDNLEEGMLVKTATSEFVIVSVYEDRHDGTVGVAQVALPDGEYEGKVITETFHPIEFLLRGN